MGIACGVLGWPPSVFWDSTPHEFWAAFETWREANQPSDSDTQDPAGEVTRHLAETLPDTL